jgi:hypothetical protein
MVYPSVESRITSALLRNRIVAVQPCLRHRCGLSVGYTPCDRVGLRPPISPPHPTPSLLRRIRLVEKTLTTKLDMIAKFAGKFLLETRGPLTGNAMFPCAPSRRGMFAGQHFRAEGQSDEIMAQSPLLCFAPRGPFLDTGHAVTSQGKDRGLLTDWTVELLCRIVNVSTRRRMTGHNHLRAPFRTTCRKRCAVRPRLVTR